MPNIKLTIAYDGTNYHGWQRQKGHITIQETIERALKKFFKLRINLTASGRTDAGVHAISQVANFKIKKLKIPIEKLTYVLNNALPEDIRILKSELVNNTFDARKSAKSKTYLYVISNSSVQSPFSSRYSWHIPDKLNIHKMRSGGKYLIGKKDFRAFMSSGSAVNFTKRTIKKITISKHDSQIFITIKSDGFLKQMVRNIIGTLVEVGMGKRQPTDIRRILNSKDRKKAGICAPANGLFLLKVEY